MEWTEERERLLEAWGGGRSETLALTLRDYPLCSWELACTAQERPSWPVMSAAGAGRASHRVGYLRLMCRPPTFRIWGRMGSCVILRYISLSLLVIEVAGWWLDSLALRQFQLVSQHPCSCHQPREVRRINPSARGGQWDDASNTVPGSSQPPHPLNWSPRAHIAASCIPSHRISLENF